jgi:3-oxoacyl-[acyl-carrier protein] reductase
VPLARLGQADDCAGAVLLLCSPYGGYITGEIIEINGGLLMD